MWEQKGWRHSILGAAAILGLAACGGSSSNSTGPLGQPGALAGNTGAQVTVPFGSGGAAGSNIVGSGQAGSSTAGKAGAAAPGMANAGQSGGTPSMPMPMMGAAGSAGSMAASAGAGAAGSGSIPAAGPTPFKGMVDGDPSAPVVTVPGVTCGKAAGFGIGMPNVKITNRDVFVAYPCNKHEGASMTFLLLLHGTNSDESSKLYIVGYFGATNYLDDHNLIIVAPKAIGSQWGNSDNGEDLPHLYDVVDYVYTNFSKFNIKSMWVGGHSWGGIYAKRFVCDAMLAGKAKGVLDMSGGPSAPQCAAQISQIHTIGEMELMGKADSTAFPDQGAAAMGHGCDKALTGPEMIATNARFYHHANCPSTFVHSDYVDIGKAHADFLDAPVVQHILDWIKSTDM